MKRMYDIKHIVFFFLQGNIENNNNIKLIKD